MTLAACVAAYLGALLTMAVCLDRAFKRRPSTVPSYITLPIEVPMDHADFADEMLARLSSAIDIIERCPPWLRDVAEAYLLYHPADLSGVEQTANGCKGQSIAITMETSRTHITVMAANGHTRKAAVGSWPRLYEGMPLTDRATVEALRSEGIVHVVGDHATLQQAAVLLRDQRPHVIPAEMFRSIMGPVPSED